MSIPRVHLEQSLRQAYDYLDSIGEYTEAAVASGSAVALTTATAANITSISLTAGDWDVSGVVGFLPAGTTSITVMGGGSSATSATIGALGSAFAESQTATVPGAVGQIRVIPTVRLNVTATTTIYLVATATFTVSTLGGYGLISARRVSKP